MTADEFETRLCELIRTAMANGVDVAGGWVDLNHDDEPEQAVEVYEVTKPVSEPP